MFKSLKSISLILGSVLVSSCGIEKSRTTDYFTEESYGIALGLESSSFSCRSSLSYTSKDKIYFSQYIDGQNSSGSMNYAELKEGAREIIQSIYKFSRFDFSKTFARDGSVSEYKGRLSDLGVAISLCPEVSYDKEENTFESAAASVVTTLVGFKNYLQKLKLDLPEKKLNLYIAPNVQVTSIFRDQKTKYKEAMINNAYYDSLNFMMVFLPQGVKDKHQDIPYGGIPLWSIPFVPVHEYAHHIFATKNPAFVQYAREKGGSVASLCFGKSSISSIINQTYNSITVFDIYSALNEGFADLMGFYANGNKNSHSLRNITCFEKNREVNSEKFYNGDKKTLGLNEIRQFIGKKTNLLGTCQYSVDYSSIHTIGAIFANSYYRMAQELKLSEEQTIKILYTWLDSMGQEPKSIMSKAADSSDFVFLLNKLESAATKIIPNRSRAFCQSMQNTFPVLQSEGNEC